jgi:hypothetical protein
MIGCAVRFEVRYKAEKLITARSDDATPLGITLVNEGQVRAKGGELEAQMRLSRRSRALMSYALQLCGSVDACRASELVI